MQKPLTHSVPKSVFFIIILLFASMFAYAAYFDTNPSEKTVNNFYNAYFSRDFEEVANNLSVFWIARFLPEYSGLPSQEMLANRALLEEGAIEVITAIEAENQLSQTLGVRINRDYTRIGEYSSLVVYEVLEDGAPVGMEVAILIHELGQPRIFDFSQVGPQNLDEILTLDLTELDNSFRELLDPASE